MKRSILSWLMLICLCLTSFAAGEEKDKPRNEALVEEMVVCYGRYGAEAEMYVAELLAELKTVDPVLGAKWESICRLWKDVNMFLTVHIGALPEGLDETDALAIVALGFQLNPDGTMRDELIERLGVVLHCAQQYPNAVIVVTGGGTALQNPSATEAGEMAKWLIDHGIAPERILVEDKSLTTAQNAIYSFDLLAEKQPQVTKLVIVSSDYHIATGTLLFQAEATLRASQAGEEHIQVVSNAAWHAPSGSLSTMFQAGALIELSGDVDTAYEIYYDTYDIHELPARR